MGRTFRRAMHGTAPTERRPLLNHQAERAAYLPPSQLAVFGFPKICCYLASAQLLIQNFCIQICIEIFLDFFVRFQSLRSLPSVVTYLNALSRMN